MLCKGILQVMLRGRLTTFAIHKKARGLPVALLGSELEERELTCRDHIWFQKSTLQQHLVVIESLHEHTLPVSQLPDTTQQEKLAACQGHSNAISLCRSG